MYRNKSGLQEQKPGGELTRLILTNRVTNRVLLGRTPARTAPQHEEQSPCHLTGHGELGFARRNGGLRGVFLTRSG
jgi:hypothetical protein